MAHDSVLRSYVSASINGTVVVILLDGASGSTSGPALAE